MMRTLFLVLFSLSFTLFLYGREDITNRCDEGNLSLSGIQQPGPLIGFGENILKQNQVVAGFKGQSFIGKDNSFSSAGPSFLYGITNSLSLYVNAPISIKNTYGKNHSAGIEDLTAQLEYAYFNQIRQCSALQGTIVANINFPTGSSHKKPPTGFGSPSYFLGTTFSQVMVHWFWFTSYGALFTTKKHGTQFGNQYLYQGGFGRNFLSPKGWIFAWLLEIDGTYYGKDKLHGKINKNSGSNVLFLTPSLWISSQHLVLQFGCGYAVQQHLFGDQKENRYLLAYNASWLF